MLPGGQPVGLVSQGLIPLIKCQGKIAWHSIGPLPSSYPQFLGLKSTNALCPKTPMLIVVFQVYTNNLLPVLSLVPHPVLGQDVLCSFAPFMHYDS